MAFRYADTKILMRLTGLGTLVAILFYVTSGSNRASATWPDLLQEVRGANIKITHQRQDCVPFNKENMAELKSLGGGGSGGGHK